jgi:hypothetical protein
MSAILTPAQQAILDQYVEDMKAVWKEKEPTKRIELKATIDASENTRNLRSFYREVIDKIKTFCPNLVEELGYKEWSNDTKTRVQNWINIVLAGNDPTAVAPTVANTVTTTATPEPVSAPDPMKDPDDDLPF